VRKSRSIGPKYGYPVTPPPVDRISKEGTVKNDPPYSPAMIGDDASPFLLTHEAARYLRFADARLFREWALRNRVPVLRRGRTLLFEKSVLRAFIDQKPWTKGRR
jgi:hypothetical protein